MLGPAQKYIRYESANNLELKKRTGSKIKLKLVNADQDMAKLNLL